MKEKISRMKEIPEQEIDKKIKEIFEELDSEFEKLERDAGR